MRKDCSNVEYSDVLGIPFDFTAKPVISKPAPPHETVQVKAVRPDRDALEIVFPRVTGYRIELPEEQLSAEFNDESCFTLTPEMVGASVTQNAGIIGEEVDLSLKHLEQVRENTILMHLTQHLLMNKFRDAGEAPKLHLFGQLKRIAIISTNSCTNIKTYANLKYINSVYLKDSFMMIRDSDGKTGCS